MALIAAPVIPWLVSVLGALLVSAFGFFADFVTKRLLVIAAVVAAIVALTLAFFAAIVAIINGLSSISPPALSQAMGLIYPANFPLIVGTTFAARVVRWVYEWNVKFLQYRL
jgi:hypothetical protein